MNSAGLEFAFKTVRAYFGSASVIEAFGAPRRFNARFCLGHVRAGLACVYESTHRKRSHVKMFLARNFRQPQGIGGRAAHHGRSEIAHHVQALDGIPSAAGDHHRADSICAFDRSPEPDERAKREWQEHAVCGSHLRTFQNVSPAIAPPIPTLGSVQHAQRSAGGARGLVYACVSVQGESRVGAERRLFFLRAHEFGFTGKREFLEIVERLNIARNDPRVVPFPCVEAIAAGDFIQKFLQLFGLQRSQSLAWRSFIALVKKGHRFSVTEDR